MELRGVSIDGKALRGTQSLDQLLTMLVADFNHQSETVLRQIAVPSGTNEQKTALDLLKQLVRAGCVITTDALHCQQETVYGITSLSRNPADAKQVAAYVRAHWKIETSCTTSATSRSTRTRAVSASATARNNSPLRGTSPSQSVD